MDMIIKKCKTCGVKYKDCDCYLGYTNVKYDLILCKCLWSNRNYENNLMRTLRKGFANTYILSNHNSLIHTNDLTVISVNLFCFCEKLFIQMITWIIGENSIKHHTVT